jgi:retron-type reverse transcriptase
MKTYKNLYPQLCSYTNIIQAYRKARKGKSHKLYVIEFDKNLAANLKKIKQELESQTYQPSPLKKFTIRDPKTRVIRKSTFKDRIVHHTIVNILQPIYDKRFIYDSYANRDGKGTIAALDRFDGFVKRVSKNGKLVRYAITRNMIKGYVLKADIRHFFDSVDQDVLLSIFERRIKDKRVLWLINKVLRNFDDKKKGMPLGNMTSQFFANVYLNDLDQFVKRRLGMKYYVRYVDDFAILHESKEKLIEVKDRIEKYLTNLRLRLHPDKSKICPLYKGVNLLGFKAFYFYRRLRKRNLLQFNRNLIKYKIQYRQRQIGYELFIEKLRGWFAYAMWGNTYSLRKDLANNVIKFLEYDAKKSIDRETIYNLAKVDRQKVSNARSV